MQSKPKVENKQMGKKSKESLKLFGSHAAPTGWGYLSGGKLNPLVISAFSLFILASISLF